MTPRIPLLRRLRNATLVGGALLFPGIATAADCPCRDQAPAAARYSTPGYALPGYYSPSYSTPAQATHVYSTRVYSPRVYSSPVYSTRGYSVPGQSSRSPIEFEDSGYVIPDSTRWSTSTRVVPQPVTRASRSRATRSQVDPYADTLNRLGGMQTIWAGTNPDQVVGVALRGDGATDANLAAIGRMTELRIVIVAPSRASAVTDAGLRHLTRLSRLEYLGLGGTSVTDRGLELVEHWPHLKRLELPGGVTDAAMPHLVALRELEQLRVWPAKITNEGLASISGIHCLRFLDLNGTHVDDDGLPLLQSLTSLEVLDLRRTHVTAEGLRHLVPQRDADCMHFSGPSRLQKLYLPNQTVVSGESLVALIRLLGICEIETTRPQPEPGKPPRAAETVVPELTSTWLERAMLEGFREEISQWKSLGAYVEFADNLVDPDFVGSLPPALLEGRPSPEDLQRLATLYREQAYRHITGLYFVRPRTKDDRARDDRIFPVTIGSSRLPPMLERLSLRDTEVSASTVASVIVPSMREGVPLKILNVFNTSAPGAAAVSKEGFHAVLGRPGTDRLPHLPFNPGLPSVTIPPVSDRPTLSPDELKSFAEALGKLDAIVVTEDQAEAIRQVLPVLDPKLRARPRYLPDELPACSVNDDGTLKPMFCIPGR